MVAWGLVIELVVGATVTAAGRFLPYTVAAMMAGDTNGGGMPQIPRGVTALPYPAAIAVLAAIAAAVAAAAALTTVRRDVTCQTAWHRAPYSPAPRGLARSTSPCSSRTARRIRGEQARGIARGLHILSSLSTDHGSFGI